jgi:hypothetical protein
MIRLALGFSISLWFTSAAIAFDFAKATDRDFADLLSRIEILQEKQTSSADIRIMRSVDSGECDPFHEWKTCPHGELYLVIAMNAEGPWDAVVWRSPRKIGWDFVQWLDTGQIDPTNSELGEVWFEVSVCEAPPEVEDGRVDPRQGGWWKHHRYEVHLGHEMTLVKPLPPPDSEGGCP